MYNVAAAAPTDFFADRGCHVRILEEIKALSRLGAAVSLCTYPNGRNVRGMDICRAPGLPWHRKITAGPSLHKLCLDPLLFARFSIMCRRKGPDVIHAYLHEGALIGGMYKKARNIPMVFDMQGSLSGELASHRFLNGNRTIINMFKKAERCINKMADAILVSSGHLRQTTIKEFGIPEESVHLIPDGIDPSLFRPIKDKAAKRASLGLPVEKKIIVYLGLLTEYQGIGILLKTARFIKDKRDDVHFLVMGYPNVGFYKTAARELGIDDVITFTGRMDYFSAPLYIGTADIAVSPKLAGTEANGKLLNYMAAGIPSVVFDTPANREILGACGVYAEYGDTDSYAKLILRLLDEPEERKELGLRSAARAVEEFSWGTIARKIMDIYEKII